MTGQAIETAHEQQKRILRDMRAKYGADQTQRLLPGALLTMILEQQRKIKGLEHRIEDLDRRCSALSMAKGLSYRAVFETGLLYHAGDLVTHKNALWHCWEQTHDQPGTSNAWQLMHKTAR